MVARSRPARSSTQEKRVDEAPASVEDNDHGNAARASLVSRRDRRDDDDDDDDGEEMDKNDPRLDKKADKPRNRERGDKEVRTRRADREQLRGEGRRAKDQGKTKPSKDAPAGTPVGQQQVTQSVLTTPTPELGEVEDRQQTQLQGLDSSGASAGAGGLLANWMAVPYSTDWDAEVAWHDEFKAADVDSGMVEIDRDELIKEAMGEGATEGALSAGIGMATDTIIDKALKKVPFAGGFVVMGQAALDPKGFAEGLAQSTAGNMVAGGELMKDADSWADYFEGILLIVEGVNGILTTITTLMSVGAAICFALCWIPGLQFLGAIGGILAGFAATFGAIATVAGLFITMARTMLVSFRIAELKTLEADPSVLLGSADSLQLNTQKLTNEWGNRALDGARNRASDKLDKARDAGSETNGADRKPITEIALDQDKPMEGVGEVQVQNNPLYEPSVKVQQNPLYEPKADAPKADAPKADAAPKEQPPKKQSTTSKAATTAMGLMTGALGGKGAAFSGPYGKIKDIGKSVTALRKVTGSKSGDAADSAPKTGMNQLRDQLGEYKAQGLEVKGHAALGWGATGYLTPGGMGSIVTDNAEAFKGDALQQSVDAFLAFCDNPDFDKLTPELYGHIERLSATTGEWQQPAQQVLATIKEAMPDGMDQQVVDDAKEDRTAQNRKDEANKYLGYAGLTVGYMEEDYWERDFEWKPSGGMSRAEELSAAMAIEAGRLPAPRTAIPQEVDTIGATAGELGLVDQTLALRRLQAGQVAEEIEVERGTLTTVEASAAMMSGTADVLSAHLVENQTAIDEANQEVDGQRTGIAEAKGQVKEMQGSKLMGFLQGAFEKMNDSGRSGKKAKEREGDMEGEGPKVAEGFMAATQDTGDADKLVKQGKAQTSLQQRGHEEAGAKASASKERAEQMKTEVGSAQSQNEEARGELGTFLDSLEQMELDQVDRRASLEQQQAARVEEGSGWLSEHTAARKDVTSTIETAYPWARLLPPGA